MTKKLLIILLLISTLDGFCQWNNNTAVNNVVSNRIGDEDEPVAVSDGANGSIIFFNDFSNSYDFYAQKITSAGTVAWGTTANPVLICQTTADKFELAAIPDGNGGAFLVWSDYRHDPKIGEIYAQRINSAGVAQWGANGKRITSSGTQDDATPILCTDGAGGVIVSWNWDNGTSDIQSFAQRLNGTGDAQWPANGRQVCTAPGFRGGNALVPDGNNGALIFFIDTRNDINGLDYAFLNNINLDLTNADIYGQRLNGNGDRLWTNNGIGIITANGNQFLSNFSNATGGIPDGAGGAIITFGDERNDDGSGTNLDIFAQRINANGASLWASNGVPVSILAGIQYLTDGVSDGAGGIVLSIADVSENKLYAQRITAAGNALWTLNGILLTNAAEDVYDAAMVTDGSGNTIFTYVSNTNVGDVIKAQKLNAAGNLLWGANGAIVCNATSISLENIDIVSSNNGSAIISWTDFRNIPVSGYDIYASKILANGTLDGSSTSLYVTAANGNWNNPATWTNGQVPLAGAAVIIRHIVSGNITTSCTSLKVEQPTGRLTVLTGIKITVTN